MQEFFWLMLGFFGFSSSTDLHGGDYGPGIDPDG